MKLYARASSPLAAVLCLLLSLWTAQAFLPTTSPVATQQRRRRRQGSASSLYMGGEKIAKQVTGEELEIMLTEWDQPLVVDAYATW